jgi:steroid delta-isomerase-like uncharacterized protein
MSVQENADVAARLIQAWNTGSVAELDQLVGPDILLFYPSMPKPTRGREAYKGFIAWLHSTFAELQISLDEVIATEDKVVARWTQRCVHQGKLLGVPPAGKPLTWTGISIFHMAQGKVVEERGEEDFLGVMWQLGVIARPGQKAG